MESFDRVYPDLLGASRRETQRVALLLFADPVADIAVSVLLTPRKCLCKSKIFRMLVDANG